MSGSSQAGCKKSNVRVAMKAQEDHQNLVCMPGCSWGHCEHVVIEPVAATGSVGNHVWYFIMGADGGPLVRVDLRVMGG